MRPQLNIDDETRDAVKEYAVQNGYTMPEAYGRLIRHGLYGRFCMRVNESGSYGVKFAGDESSVTTNISADKLQRNLEYHAGDWVTIYAPRIFALERAGVDVDIPPSVWFDHDDEAEPKAVEDPNDK